MNIRIGKLFTRPLSTAPDSIGFFEVEVGVSSAMFLADADKRGLAMRTVSQYLAVAMISTEVPQEYWYIEFDPKMQKEFNLPVTLSFSQEKLQ